MAGDGLSPDDVMNVLIATDIHLGYAENDPIRGEDSFNTFEEILQIAQISNVDFILLGGDLFHDAKPSPACFHKCATLLRKYCMGNKPVQIEILSDQTMNFPNSAVPNVNYEDPNLNIAIPVFSIHGNHDDPAGLAQLSSLDILHAMGLINYFGKITKLDEIELYPILLQKGITKVALYGLSHIKDKRLARLFKEERVAMLQPADGEEWFSILALHQNRVDRGVLNYIPESVIPDFMNFVLWGHEHDCRIDTEISADNDVHISQPGSSVATSLSQEESGRKYVGLLSIERTNFKFQKIQLKTVRPFIFQTSFLDEFEHDLDSKRSLAVQVEEYIREEIDRLISHSKDYLTGHPKQPTLPLIRIRVEYSREAELFNAVRAGQVFIGKVANPADLILLRKSTKAHNAIKADDIFDAKKMEQSTQSRVESKVEEYFREAPEKKRMQVLSVKGMCQGIIAFVDKSDSEAIELVMNHQIERTLKILKDREVPTNLVDLENAISEVAKERFEKQKDLEEIEAEQLLNDPKRERILVSTEEPMVEQNDSEDDVPLKPARGRGSRGGRGGGRGGPRTPRGSKANKSVNNSSFNSSLHEASDDDNEVLVSPTTRSSGRRGRPTAKAAAAAAKSQEITHSYSTQNRRAATVGKSYIIDVLSDSD